MKARCRNPKHIFYHRYGGRGITYVPGWETFQGFLGDMGERPEGTTLDRIDPDKGYSRDNCRWATKEQQASNKRNTVLIDIDGETMIASQWSKRSGVKPSTILMRLKYGWPNRDAVFTPVGSKR
ncbi:hypothetical protein [Ralstonia phage P-PSG-11-1]|uniref:Uncharacterized protein n=1 Tax=Ralstonia phage P-PSG-11 TaxID=2652430 RepID=A0A5P8D6T0_9CAUD|nr:hypothetical protein [Ralstonia phage P-PSG-11]QFP93758.1 hypothetical protein [Ralstonia phage P-PSG-11-1]